MDISVIIPSYKPKAYIWECLSSLLAQTLPKEKFEVIVILNGCNAPYYGQIENYIKEHDVENIIIYQTDTPGVSNARNIGINNSRGEYIAFIDDDDFVSPSYLEELLWVSSHNTIGISNEMGYNEEDNSFFQEAFSLEFDKKAPKGKHTYPCTRRFFSGPWMKLFHRSIIGAYRFDTDFSNGEDGIFQFQISRNMKYIDYTSPQAIYYRRVRLGSAMSKERNKYFLIKNRIKIMGRMTCIYFSSPTAYNILFFLTRIMASFRSVVTGIVAMIISYMRIPVSSKYKTV